MAALPVLALLLLLAGWGGPGAAGQKRKEVRGRRDRGRRSARGGPGALPALSSCGGGGRDRARQAAGGRVAGPGLWLGRGRAWGAVGSLGSHRSNLCFCRKQLFCPWNRLRHDLSAKQFF